MQENKYYTPTLEEFHVGFEYEIDFHPKRDVDNIDELNGIFDTKLVKTGKFEKKVFDSTTTADPRDFTNKYWNFKYLVRNDLIRVKHLTKEDIESLGFKPDYDKAWGERMCFENDYCALTYQEENNILQVVTRKDYIYKGLIKNKSELQKLMQQLNINIKEEV